MAAEFPVLLRDRLATEHVLERILAIEAEARATPPSLDRRVWRLIESYNGTIEIDNVQRFRDHLAASVTSKEER